MELWIRSQDKRLLMKIETIALEHNDNYARIRGYGKNDDFILGIYKTKERALEVLEDIIEILKHKCCQLISVEAWQQSLLNYTNEKREEIINKMCVYEMPKE